MGRIRSLGKRNVFLTISITTNVALLLLFLVIVTTPFFDYVFFEKSLPNICLITKAHSLRENSSMYNDSFRSVCEYREPNAVISATETLNTLCEDYKSNRWMGPFYKLLFEKELSLVCK
jgi:hypothetical protein